MADFAVGDDEKVPCVVGVAVEYGEDGFGTVNDKIGFVVAGHADFKKKIRRISFFGLDIGIAPRRPKVFHT